MGEAERRAAEGIRPHISLVISLLVPVLIQDAILRREGRPAP